MPWFLVVAIMLWIPGFARADHPPLEVVAEVDLERYEGTWHEIARLPNRFQRKCVGEVSATYTLVKDTELKVVNRCRLADGSFSEAEGLARLADPDGPPSKLEVRFAPRWLSWLPAVWGDYWILSLADDYAYVVVGTPDRDYLWILARQPVMDASTYDELVGAMGERGFPVDELLVSGRIEP